jgi:hypothetical protein
LQYLTVKAVKDVEDLKQQLYSKEEEEDKHKKEIERLSVQLAFKDKELKEVDQQHALATPLGEENDLMRKNQVTIKLPHSNLNMTTDQTAKKSTATGQKRNSRHTEQPEREDANKKQKVHLTEIVLTS